MLFAYDDHFDFRGGRLPGIVAWPGILLTARAATVVSIRAAVRADTKADAKVAARNKLIRLIVIWDISYPYWFSAT